MKEEKIIFKLEGKRTSIKARKLLPHEMIKGLMFCRRENARALLFQLASEERMAIHSFFVFFPFIAVWLDKNNKLVGVKIVKPFTFYVCPKRKFKQLIEIPINKKYEFYHRRVLHKV
jgi:uncharacterized membrane protein (UPF0127 family)